MSHSSEKGATESTIRFMSRLAMQHGAVNLSQGFPNEGPNMEGVNQAILGILAGDETKAAAYGNAKLVDVIGGAMQANKKQRLANGYPTLATGGNSPDAENDAMTLQDYIKDWTITDLLKALHKPGKDMLNQYSMPFGRPQLRQEIVKYYKRWYSHCTQHLDADKHLTVTMGATEAMACALRAVCAQGDSILVIEPFHEMYLTQPALFNIKCKFTALQENVEKEEWEINWEDFEEKAKGCRCIILCDPHNPTGKVFTPEELKKIIGICLRNEREFGTGPCYILGDEMYEWMIFDEAPVSKHILSGFEFANEFPATADGKYPGIVDRYMSMNSFSKTWSVTGWRLGWVVTPEHLTQAVRGVHDQLVACPNTPIQFAGEKLLQLPEEYYENDVRRKYQKRRDYLLPELRKLGFKVSTVRSAYYAFVNFRSVPFFMKYADRFKNPMDVSMFLIKEIGVATVPGNNFFSSNTANSNSNDYIRICFVRTFEELQEAVQRLQKLNDTNFCNGGA
eukprot:gnl/MRDRNA2_/MRDRNA2_100943_c0_seq1.p1 gnl/MRDRNA2_/MRDRNA2_100943_c0~~gnl/MRDRNA2_/MRDRNA2_100943_c0_seq1.p1  ORF type:complete len:508 (-),score=73.75 gnl/MRDRNA2_/MRDRNA2_100943_c0_seq1:254-1777(-)